MGQNISSYYYDLKVENNKFPIKHRSELYIYAYFLENNENILYDIGYSIDENSPRPVFEKAETRAILDRPPESENDHKKEFNHITKLPRELLKSCKFQKKLNLYYDKDLIDWALYYKRVKNCHS